MFHATATQPHLHVRNVLALIWDFDKTLTPGYMQQPLFEHFGVDEKTFWEEVNSLEADYKRRGVELVSKDTLYLTHILTYVREGIFKNLNNRLLKELGAAIQFYPGLPDFFAAIKDYVQKREEFQRHEIKVEHYIVSTGLRQMIRGSRIADSVDGIWGCEFVEGSPRPGYLKQKELAGVSGAITDIAYSIDNTAKTRAIFEINKGANKNGKVDVNMSVPYEERRVPFQNMIYIADGPSDIPVFSVVKQYGGKCLGVYNPASKRELKQVYGLQSEGRVHSFVPADYRENGHTARWLEEAVEEIATRISQARDEALGNKPVPKHIIE